MHLLGQLSFHKALFNSGLSINIFSTVKLINVHYFFKNLDSKKYFKNHCRSQSHISNIHITIGIVPSVFPPNSIKNLNLGSSVIYAITKNLYVGQEATVRTGHGTKDWLQIGKGVRQGCILSPCLFNVYAEHIMRNAGLEEAQLESRLLGEISVTSDMQMTPPLWQKVKRN